MVSPAKVNSDFFGWPHKESEKKVLKQYICCDKKKFLFTLSVLNGFYLFYGGENKKVFTKIFRHNNVAISQVDSIVARESSKAFINCTFQTISTISKPKIFISNHTLNINPKIKGITQFGILK